MKPFAGMEAGVSCDEVLQLDTGDTPMGCLRVRDEMIDPTYIAGFAGWLRWLVRVVGVGVIIHEPRRPSGMEN
jgi:hypothetical protein